MDLHGGSISVESSGEGQGSSFTVTLPLFEDDFSEVENGYLPSPINRGELVAKYFSSDISSILVVDDSAINRKMLCRLFDSKSIPCDQAEDGCIAVDMVQRVICNQTATDSNQLVPGPSVEQSGSMIVRGQYDVILMDYQMPNMDGPTAIRAMRSLGYKGVIIGVTGNVMALDQQEMIAAGADDVLSKPFEIDKFWEIYNRVRRLSEDSLV